MKAINKPEGKKWDWLCSCGREVWFYSATGLKGWLHKDNNSMACTDCSHLIHGRAQ